MSFHPLIILGDILEQIKNKVKRNSYSKSLTLGRFYDREKVSIIEPIHNLLKDLEKRIEILEKKMGGGV